MLLHYPGYLGGRPFHARLCFKKGLSFGAPDQEHDLVAGTAAHKRAQGNQGEGENLLMRKIPSHQHDGFAFQKSADQNGNVTVVLNYFY